ncbi:MAG: 4Fe-4S double cluster binding domain-containing protein [Candidatus Heimdallarchaeota archaeon]
MSSQSEASSKPLDLVYKYKTLSVEHFTELQEDINKLKREKKLSDHEVYRSYIDDKKFELPETFPEAKSLVVMAIATKLMLANFQLNGRNYEVMVPPGYYSTGLSVEILKDIISDEIINESGYKVEMASQLHLKLLAVRSGLGRYGRNNICYVDGMGSMLRLFAFFTDYQFEEDNWTELQMLEKCQECRICMKQCPHGAITEENFVVDVGKCVTLYNEIEGDFPTWISPDSHNALMGCMKCQSPCPANREVINQTGRMKEVIEEETKQLLDGILDETTMESLSSKLQYPLSEETVPVFSRNLRVLIQPNTPKTTTS